jgi:hypothetical protein
VPMSMLQMCLASAHHLGIQAGAAGFKCAILGQERLCSLCCMCAGVVLVSCWVGFFGGEYKLGMHLSHHAQCVLCCAVLCGVFRCGLGELLLWAGLVWRTTEHGVLFDVSVSPCKMCKMCHVLCCVRSGVVLVSCCCLRTSLAAPSCLARSTPPSVKHSPWWQHRCVYIL